MRKLRYSIYIHIVRLPSVGQVFGSLCLGGSIVTPLVSVLVCLFSPFRYAFGPNLVRFAHPAYSGRMLKQWNIGILGSGKLRQWFIGKTLLTTKLVNEKLVCKIIPANHGIFDIPTFQYSLAQTWHAKHEYKELTYEIQKWSQCIPAISRQGRPLFLPRETYFLFHWGHVWGNTEQPQKTPLILICCRNSETLNYHIRAEGLLHLVDFAWEHVTFIPTRPFLGHCLYAGQVLSVYTWLVIGVLSWAMKA